MFTFLETWWIIYYSKLIFKFYKSRYSRVRIYIDLDGYFYVFSISLMEMTCIWEVLMQSSKFAMPITFAIMKHKPYTNAKEKNLGIYNCDDLILVFVCYALTYLFSTLALLPKFRWQSYIQYSN